MGRAVEGSADGARPGTAASAVGNTEVLGRIVGQTDSESAGAAAGATKMELCAACSHRNMAPNHLKLTFVKSYHQQMSITQIIQNI